MPHENNKPAKSCFRDATAAHDAETVKPVVAVDLDDAESFSLVKTLTLRLRRAEEDSRMLQEVMDAATDSMLSDKQARANILAILNRPAKKGKK